MSQPPIIVGRSKPWHPLLIASKHVVYRIGGSARPSEAKSIGANTSHDPHLHVWRQTKTTLGGFIYTIIHPKIWVVSNPPILVALNPDFAAGWSIFANQTHIICMLLLFQNWMQDNFGRSKQTTGKFVCPFPPESTESFFAAYPHLANEIVKDLLTIQIHFMGLIIMITTISIPVPKKPWPAGVITSMHRRRGISPRGAPSGRPTPLVVPKKEGPQWLLGWRRDATGCLGIQPWWGSLSIKHCGFSWF